MENFFNHQETSTNGVFDDRYLNTRILYLCCFNSLPNLYFFGEVDGEKACKVFTERHCGQIADFREYNWYNQKKRKFQFERTILILKNRCIVEFGKSYCELLHEGQNEELVQEVIKIINQFKEKQKGKSQEINLIVKGSDSFSLRKMEIKRTKLDLNLFYEDDFKEVDALITKRIRKNNDKGIVLLHGLPGTGKTTYLRYLIGKTRKRVLLVSPSVAENLMNPEFIDLLVYNPNSLLIIEDAENIITDRKYSSSSSVSNLLNISDGLLSDFLNVQLICTFNSPLTMIDAALMRKGRLIAHYEFGKLGVPKAQRLSDHLGFNTKILKPMTIAEIAIQNEKEHIAERMEIIGFKRPDILQN